MMRITLTLFTLLILLIASPTVRADTDLQALRPLLDQHTMAVGRVDMTTLDIDAVVDAVLRQVDRIGQITGTDLAQPKAAAEGVRALAKVWQTQFTTAGGQRLYFIFTPAMFPNDAGEVVAVIAPLTPDADAQAIIASLSHQMSPVPKPPRNRAVKQIGSAVVAGHSRLVEHFEHAVRPVGRPNLLQGLKEIKDAPIGIVQALSPDHRRVFAEMPISTRGTISELDIAQFAADLRYATAKLTHDDGLTIECAGQFNDVAGAQRATLLGRQAIELMIREDPDTPPQVIAALFQLYKPHIPQPDRVTLRWTEQEIDRIIDSLRPALMQARAQANQATSMANIRQTLVAIISYEDKHKAWPNSLQQLVDTGFLPSLPRSPLQSVNPNPYVYIKPDTKPVSTPYETILLYERTKAPAGTGQVILAGYADGHVEKHDDEAALPESHRKK